jgi:hypothetical protein
MITKRMNVTDKPFAPELLGNMDKNKQELAAIAKAMLAPGKGLLAMDESNRTCNKRFEDVGSAPTQENRRAYRELILTTPDLGTAISGAILYDETIHPSGTSECATDRHPRKFRLRKQSWGLGSVIHPTGWA